jgi:hypothetical protein
MSAPFPLRTARHNDPSITDALAMWSTWHCDAPPIGATGSFATDLRIADAFRMMIFLGDPTKRLRWIEREVSDPTGKHVGCPYRAELCRWWLTIFSEREAERKSA